jgi:hypothetical protein
MALKADIIRRERDSNVRKMKILIISICTVVIWRQILDIVRITKSKESELQIQIVALQRYVLNIFLILTMCFSIRDTVKTMQKQEQ